jgi:HD domain
MKQNDLILFKRQFSMYCRSFYSANSEDQRNIDLKEEHTRHVCENMAGIGRGLSLSHNQMMLAETIGLFHDVGRFPQYAKYRTFRDSISVNHGLLGAETLVEKKILQTLPHDEQEIIIQSVKFHNAFAVPKKEKDEIIFFIRLIRDADKLDIWRVFLEYYKAPDENRASAVGLGLPDVPEYTDEVLANIFKEEIVSLSMIKTLNDFKLLQLSWVFDLNYKPAFRILLERDYLNRIIAHLPQTEGIQKASLVLKEFMQKSVSDYPI